jgi:hypothetical protein
MYKFFKVYFPFLLGALLLGTISCKEDNEPIVKAQKVTTVSLQLNAEGKGKTDVSFTFKDLNGVIGKTAESPLVLDANTTYTGTILLEDESVSPKRNVSATFDISYWVGNANVSVTENSGALTVVVGNATTSTDGQLRIRLTENAQSSDVMFPLLVR